MFESLSDRLSSTFKSISGRAQLTETNIQEAMREVRLALLEADVNFKVVKEFTETVKEKALGVQVIKGVNPSQQLIKVVHDELVSLLGGDQSSLELTKKPTIMLMVGLQGSGKTTSSAKIANLLRKQKKQPYLVPCDVYRPAAIDQLKALSQQLNIPCYQSTSDMNPVDIAKNALLEAEKEGYDLIILDTAGRLHIDETLMGELSAIKEAVSPQEILFVADAMTGQDAVTVATSFNEQLGITGVVLTKMDGDARGGAALSIRSVTGAPVKLVGMGEKLSEIEFFHPDRIAGRILGMGDVLTLLEKAQTTIDEKEAEALAKKFQKASFDFEDFKVQMKRMKSLGSLESILKMIPGLGGMASKLSELGNPEKELSRTEAIINSMTIKERRNPELINPSRKERIAKGSGTSVAQVNQLMQQFDQMRKMMQSMMGGGKMPKMPKGMQMPKGFGGMGGMPNLGGLSNSLGGLGGLGALGGMGGMGMPALPKSGSTKSATKKQKTKQKKKKKR